MSGSRELRGIVLDMDDTLYLEWDYVRSGFGAVARAVLDEPRDVERWSGWLFADATTRHDAHTFDRFVEQCPQAASRVVADLVAIYRDHEPDITLGAGWSSLLREWRSLGMYLAVITDGPISSQARKAAALGLTDLVDDVILTDALGRDHWKPAQTAFRIAQERSGLSGGQLVYVGDNVLKDFVAPNQLSWRSIRYRTAGQVRGHLEPATRQHAAECELASPAGVAARIHEWRGASNSHRP